VVLVDFIVHSIPILLLLLGRLVLVPYFVFLRGNLLSCIIAFSDVCGVIIPFLFQTGNLFISFITLGSVQVVTFILVFVIGAGVFILQGHNNHLIFDGL